MMAWTRIMMAWIRIMMACMWLSAGTALQESMCCACADRRESGHDQWSARRTMLVEVVVLHGGGHARQLQRVGIDELGLRHARGHRYHWAALQGAELASACSTITLLT